MYWKQRGKSRRSLGSCRDLSTPDTLGVKVQVKSAGSKTGAPRRRILVVDDEEGFRDGLADLLNMEGYTVSVARNAVEAVPMLPDFRPDLILLDLRMPLLDGEAFLRGMRGLPASREVPVVLISAKEELRDIAARYGAAGYLSKPFEAPQLLSLLERVLA